MQVLIENIFCCFTSHRYFQATQTSQTLVELIDKKEDTAIDLLLEEMKSAFSTELECSTIHEYKSLPPFLLPFTSCWLYAKLLWRISEYLDKRGDHIHSNEILERLLAQGVVCSGYRGRWYERLALNHDYHLKKKEKVFIYQFVMVILSSYCISVTMQ